MYKKSRKGHSSYLIVICPKCCITSNNLVMAQIYHEYFLVGGLDSNIEFEVVEWCID